MQFSRSICRLKLWANSLVLEKKKWTCWATGDCKPGISNMCTDLWHRQILHFVRWFRGTHYFFTNLTKMKLSKLHDTIWVQILMHHINQWTMIHILSHILQGHKFSISYSSSMNLFHSLIHSFIGQRFSVYWMCYSAQSFVLATWGAKQKRRHGFTLT